MKEVDIYSNIEDAVKMVVANKVDLVRHFFRGEGGHKAGCCCFRQLALYLQSLSTHRYLNMCYFRLQQTRSRPSRGPCSKLHVCGRSWCGRCNR